MVKSMKHCFLSIVAGLMMSLTAMADNVPGITVEYLDSGTGDYVQAISAIGRIEFSDGKATLVFKDDSTEELGEISSINRITFGEVNEGDIPTELPQVEHKISVNAYPNPTADHLHIDGLQEGQTVRLFSTSGSLVYTGQEADINLSGMANGVYILQVGKEIIKIIKK